MFIFQNHRYLYFLSYSHAFHRPAFNQLFFKEGTPKLFCFSGFDFCALTQNDRGTVHFPSDHDPFGIRTLAFFPPRLSHICLRLYPTDLLWQNVDICRSHTNESTVSSQKQKSIILKTHQNEILQSSRLCIVWENSAVNEWLHLGDWWRELCYTVVCILSFRNGSEVVSQSAHIWRDARVFQ